jgi:hypothetical protein
MLKKRGISGHLRCGERLIGRKYGVRETRSVDFLGSVHGSLRNGIVLEHLAIDRLDAEDHLRLVIDKDNLAILQRSTSTDSGARYLLRFVN